MQVNTYIGGMAKGTEIVTRKGVKRIEELFGLDFLEIRGEGGDFHEAKVVALGQLPAYYVQLGKHAMVTSDMQLWPVFNSQRKLKCVKPTKSLDTTDKVRPTFDTYVHYKFNNHGFEAGIACSKAEKLAVDFDRPLDYLYSWLQGVFYIKGTVDTDGYHIFICSSDFADLVFLRSVCLVVGINTNSILKCGTSNYYKLTLNASSLSEYFFKNVIHIDRWNLVTHRGAEYQRVKSADPVGSEIDMYAICTNQCRCFTLASGELLGTPSLLLGDENGIGWKDSRGKNISIL